MTHSNRQKGESHERIRPLRGTDLSSAPSPPRTPSPALRPTPLWWRDATAADRLGPRALRRRAVGDGRWPHRLHLGGRVVTNLGRLAGPRRLGADPHPGAAHGAHPDPRAGLGSGRARASAPARRLHVVQPHDRPHRADDPRLQRRHRSRASSARSSTRCSTPRACCSPWPARSRSSWSSSRRSRRPRRLRYESWHLLHLYAYLGAGLALPHQLWTGADFTSSTVATVFWWGLYAAALACVIAYRVVLPLVRSRGTGSSCRRCGPSRRPSPRSSSRDATSTGCRCEPASSSSGASSTARAASRANPYGSPPRPTAAACASRPRPSATRAAGSPRSSRARRCSWRVPTAGSTPVCAPGSGPCSSAPASASRRCARCSRSCPPAPTPPSSSTASGASPTSSWREELLELARAKGARVVAVVGHRRTDRASWLPADSAHLGEAEALLRIVPDIAHRDVYVCGNPAWMDTVIAAAKDAGVPAASIHHERFSY